LDVSDRQVERIACNDSVYSVGVFNKYDAPVRAGNHVVLVNPEYRGNLGTIIRTMDACNVRDLIIITPAVDIFHPEVVRASMGSLFGMRFSFFTSMRDYLAAFPNTPYCFRTDGRIALTAAVFHEPYSLVFGSEAGDWGGSLRVSVRVSGYRKAGRSTP
jgi:TrmH family RNA methyltransferase